MIQVTKTYILFTVFAYTIISSIHSALVYNTNTEICCNGKPYEKNDTIACCEREVFNKGTGRQCCGNKTYPDEEISQKGKLCCVWDGTLTEGKPEQAFVGSLANCCGGKVYDAGTQICCGAKIYDAANSICCDGVLNKLENCARLDSYDCCRSKAYDTNKQTCCRQSGKLVDRAEDDNKIYGCCNDQLHEYYDKICCQGKTYPLMKNDQGLNYKAYCCEKQGAVVNVGRQACCDGIVTELKEGNDACCGTTQYNSNLQTCCGTKVINDDEQLCCNNEVVTRNTKYDACCV